MHEPFVPPDAVLPAAAPAESGRELHAFHFSGSGQEYFKIWIVNLLLTVLTLGVYSAWAKVRRLQYFDRNTHLAGAVFDFDGQPKAILRGRLIALVLVLAYHYAFDLSVTAGVITIAVLLALLPLAMRGALRFRLRHTRYRGVRCDFAGTPGAAYAAYLPALLLFLLPAAVVALDPSGVSMFPFFFAYLLFPLMHGAMKSYQHRHLRFGTLTASYALSKRSFYGPYFVALVLGVAGSLVLGLFGALFVAILAALPLPHLSGPWLYVLGIVLAMYIGYLLSAPYLMVKLGNMTWSATSLPGLTVESDIPLGGFIKLQVANTLLTLLTLGLYRPFAAVRIHRFRLAHIRVSCDAGFERTVAAAAAPQGGASADGVADFLGVDLSW